MFRLLFKYTMQKKYKITLTPIEKEIFSMVLNCCKAKELKTVVRVAGGWVRDKLMNKESHDIDLTLDDMKGEQFAQIFKEYFKDQKVSGFGVTRLNPDLSKHLETATIQVKGLEIDIVNLRSEKYAHDTRIPTIEIGTPKEDAERRDLTINSMFYNLVTEEVEDWTGQGISDLENGVIRTPLDPYITFKDDPLRILRSFRFAGRYNFKVVPELFEAVKKHDIQEALKHKVSKQRVGKELVPMLRHPNSVLPIRMLYENDLWNVVFEIPKDSDLKDITVISSIPAKSYGIFKAVCEKLPKIDLQKLPGIARFIVEKEQKGKENVQNKTYTLDQLRVCILLSSLTLVYQPYTVIVNKKKEPLVEYMVKESLKLSNKQATFCERVARAVVQLEKVIVNAKKNQVQGEKKVIAVIKWLRSIGELWQPAIIVAEAALPHLSADISQMIHLIESNKLQQIHHLKAPIDGKFVMQTLGRKGPAIGTILSNSQIWCALHQNASKDEFIEEIKKNLAFFENPKAYD